MDKVDIKTAEDLNKVLSDVQAKVESAKAAADAIAEKKLDEAVASLSEAQKKAQEDMKVLNESLTEQIKGLTLAFKTNWQEKNLPESADYRLGKFVNTMIQAKHGVKKAAGDLLGFGAAPVKEVQDENEGWAKMPCVFEKTSPTIAATPLSSDDSSTYYGSYLVSVQYVADVLRTAQEASSMMPLVTHYPMTGITAYIPTTTDSFTFTKLTNQQTAKTEDTLTLSRATLTACVYALWMAISEEMDEDSLVALGTLIRTMMGEAWGLKFDDLALDDSTYGALALCANEVTMDSGDSAYSDINIDYLDQLIQALGSRNLRQGARFFMHTTVFDYVRNLKDANGNYIFQDSVNAAPATIRGYPFTLSDGMPPSSESTASDDFVLFGNPRHILAGDRVGFEFRIFDQTAGTMQYDQIYLRARARQAMTLGLTSAMSKLTTAA